MRLWGRPDGGMVDTRDLKSLSYCSCAGSSPASGTLIHCSISVERVFYERDRLWRDLEHIRIRECPFFYLYTCSSIFSPPPAVEAPHIPREKNNCNRNMHISPHPFHAPLPSIRLYTRAYKPKNTSEKLGHFKKNALLCTRLRLCMGAWSYRSNDAKLRIGQQCVQQVIDNEYNKK